MDHHASTGDAVNALCSGFFPFAMLPSLRPLLSAPVLLWVQPTPVKVLMQGPEQLPLCESFVSHHLCFFTLRVRMTDTVCSLAA